MKLLIFFGRIQYCLGKDSHSEFDLFWKKDNNTDKDVFFLGNSWVDNLHLSD
jgi:hypothetical protein